MAKTITQEIVFKNTSPNIIYDLYMKAKKHSASTGALAIITTKEGIEYSAHDGYITGKNLKLVKNKLIVQTWRASDWKKEDVDSIFIIHLQQKGKDVLLFVTHANLPDRQADEIDTGWVDFYWEPWKKYLEGESKKAQ